MNRPPSVFLCYAKEDQAAVEGVYIQLKNAGFTPWMDKPPRPFSMEGIGPGERWDKKIRHVIQHADYFLAFLSPVSVSKRGYVQREYRLALDRMNELPDESVFVIPVLLAECVPPTITVGQVSFKDVQWYELYDRGLDELIRYIRMVSELREKKDIELGKRLVIDFGTSNTAISVASEARSGNTSGAPISASEEKVLTFDIGGGTTDIGLSGVHFRDRGDADADVNKGDAALTSRVTGTTKIPGQELLYTTKDRKTVLMVQTFGDYRFKTPVYHISGGRRLSRVLLVHLQVRREPTPEEKEQRITNAVENIVACAPDIVGLGGLGSTARRLEALLRARPDFTGRISYWGRDVGIDAGTFLTRHNVPEPW